MLDPRTKAQRAVPGCPTVWTSLAAGVDTPALSSWPEWWRQNDEGLAHDRHTPVVILDEPDADASKLAESLASFLRSLEDSANEGLARLRRHCREIWIVHGGASAVLESFPLLSSEWPEQRPTPHQIAPGVLLGSRAVPLTHEHLVVGLGVTHMIVPASVDTPSFMMPVSQEAGLRSDIEGIQTLRLAMCDDDADAPMAAVWEQSCAFVTHALQSGGCVMICLHGRSRSASCALAWLAKAHSLSVGMAASILQRKCPSIDWRLVFPEQLLLFLSTKPLQLE